MNLLSDALELLLPAMSAQAGTIQLMDISVISSKEVPDVFLAGGAQRTPTPTPLVVDLNGTLIKTDLLIESVLALVRKQPLTVCLLPVWMAFGKVCFTQQVGRRVVLDLGTLPWRNALLDYLKRQRGEGRSLVLAPGSGDIRLAQQVADHLQLFDVVLAGDASAEVSGDSKRNRLVREFGEKGFDYAAGGSTRRDLMVWASARNAILVNPEAMDRSEAARVSVIDQVVADPRTGVAGRVKALRPTHWLKNLLVLLPVVVTHRFHEIASLEQSVLAFVAFCCCASSGYLFNDLIDLDADRHHPRKRSRPFAAGDLPLSYALVMIPALLVSGCVLGALVSRLFLAMLLAYWAMSAAYSLHVKKVAVLDVLFLSGLYSVRIMAGSAAIGLSLSHWMLVFSTFVFLSLALVKRYSELVVMHRIDGDGARARAYEFSDGELLAAMGTASGYLAVLVFAWYLAGDNAQGLDAHPELLWALCPLLLYWISHVWLTAHRGRMDDDPVVFAINDRTSQILIVLMLATALQAL